MIRTKKKPARNNRNHSNNRRQNKIKQQQNTKLQRHQTLTGHVATTQNIQSHQKPPGDIKPGGTCSHKQQTPSHQHKTWRRRETQTQRHTNRDNNEVQVTTMRAGTGNHDREGKDTRNRVKQTFQNKTGNTQTHTENTQIHSLTQAMVFFIPCHSNNLANYLFWGQRDKGCQIFRVCLKEA